MSLLGPDGKELKAAPAEPRKGPTRQEKFNMCYMMFTLMDRAERHVLIKTLRPLRRKLDLLYPNGMSEDDIRRDIEKQVNSMPESKETTNAEPSGTQSSETPSNPSEGLRPNDGDDGHKQETGVPQTGVEQEIENAGC